MICYKRIPLLCCAASRDVSISAFRARMAHAVSSGASAAVEELATSPPTKTTSSISAVAAEDGVRSVLFLLGGIVIGARATLLARCIGFATDVSSLQESSIWESVCVWWDRLERQSGTRFTLPARHRKSISYTCRLRAHLCSLGSRLRLRNSHESAEQSVAKASVYLPRLVVHRTAMHSRSVELCVVALRGNRGPGYATCSRSPWLRQGW